MRKYNGGTAQEHLDWIDEQIETPMAEALHDPYTYHVILAMREMCERLVKLDAEEVFIDEE